MLQYNRGILAREILRDYTLNIIQDIDRRVDIETALMRVAIDLGPEIAKSMYIWSCGYAITINQDELQRAWLLFSEYLRVDDTALIIQHTESSTKQLIAYSKLCAIKAHDRI